MSDEFAPKLTAKQRAQVEAVRDELMDKAENLIFGDESSPASAQGSLQDELPWINYLIHAADDGKKDSSVRSPTKRIGYAKKIKSRLKKIPTIADLQSEQSLTAEIDDETIAKLDKDLSNCCSGMPPLLWGRREKLNPNRSRKTG